MTSTFVRAPLALAVSMLLAQSTLWAASLPAVDHSLVPQVAAKAKAVADATPRLQWQMRALPSAFDAKSLGAEGAARAHLAQLLARQDVGKHAGEAFELHSTSPLSGGAHIVQFTRRVNGIEVFREDVGLLIDAQSRLVAFRGRDALLQSQGKSLPAFVLGADDAAALAMSAYGFDRPIAQKSLRPADRAGDYEWFATTPGLRSATGAVNRRPVRVKPVYFPVAGAGLVPAYYVETQIQPDEHAAAEYYAHVLSAVDGRVLFRHFQQADGAIPEFSYRVWAEVAPPGLPHPSPYGRNGTPHPTGTNNGYTPTFVAPSMVTISNYPFSNGDNWLSNGATETTGNNTDAYADISAPDGFSPGDLRATLTAPYVFDRTYDVNQEPGVSSDQRMAAVTQQFYWVNWLHDFHYDAGFAEIDGNAQASNYGRGGLENDSMLAEGQDHSGLNNANMATPADGARPRMQMYLFSPPTAPHTLTFNAAPYAHGIATFGAQSFTITGEVVVALDAAGSPAGSTTTDACTALTNAGAVAGKIAFIDRGSCTFDLKVKNAQNAGAIGAIIGSVAPGSAPNMPPSGQTGITIGAMSVGFDDANTMRTALSQGAADTATLFRDVPGVSRDGTIDGTIIAHEWGHYISNRLIGNASGLSNPQGGAMGEGWADFNAMLAIVRAEDAYTLPPNFSGTYATGSYASGEAYFGIRRYPYSVNMSNNPLMFRHTVTGAPLPTNPAPAFNGNNAEVHNAGEVWATALWECYVSLLNAHPFQEAQDRMKRYVIGGYKLTPSAPTFLEARDALLATALAVDPADFQRFAIAFARRGMGIGAVAAPRNSTDNVGVVENTAIGGDLATISLNADDNAACDNDGVVDRDESGSISVDVRNSGWVSLGGGSVSVTANHAGLVFPFGNTVALVASDPYQNQTVSVPVRLDAIPPSRVVQLTATPTEASIVNPPGTARTIHVRVASDEVPAASSVERFGANAYPWSTALANGASAGFAWYRSDLDSNGNRVAIGPDSVGVGTTSLVSAPISVGSGSFSIALTHRYSFEADTKFWDGGIFEISDDNGASWASIGGSTYDATINGDIEAGNPLHGQSAYVGNSPGYPATTVDTIHLGTAYANQSVRLRFTVGTDAGVGAPGWELHAVALTGAGTPFAAVIPQHTSCSTSAIDVFYDGFE